MRIIQSAAALQAACHDTADPELGALLDGYLDMFDEFGADIQVDIVVFERGDKLACAEQALGKRLVADSRFTFPVEAINRGEIWLSVVWIYSDDGAGLVLLVDGQGCADAGLLAACEMALTEAGG